MIVFQSILTPLESLVLEDQRKDYRAILNIICPDIGFRWNAARVHQAEPKYRKLKYEGLKDQPRDRPAKTMANSPNSKPKNPNGRTDLN
jgi:hypothetical protein